MPRNPAYLACLLLAAVIAAERPAAADEPTNAKGRVVLACDFEDDEALGQFARRTISKTPTGDRRYLGPYTIDVIPVELTDLPAHRYVRIELDLYIIRSWDGENRDVGPDRWMIQMAGHRDPLLHASFSNITHDAENNRQSYPADFREARVKPQTAATERNTLGYTFSYGQTGEVAADSVYRIDRLVPHEEDALTLRFRGMGLQNVADEAWGIDNLKITVYEKSPLPPASTKQLRAWVEALADGDPIKFTRARRELVGRTEAAAPLLLNFHQSNADESIDADWVAARVAELGSDDFERRESASTALAEAPRWTAEYLARARRSVESEEKRWRLAEAIRRIEGRGRDTEKKAFIEDPVKLAQMRRVKNTAKLMNTPRMWQAIAAGWPYRPAPEHQKQSLLRHPISSGPMWDQRP